MDQRNALKARRDIELANIKGMVPLCAARYAVRGAPTHTHSDTTGGSENSAAFLRSSLTVLTRALSKPIGRMPQVFSYKSVVRK